MKKVGFIGLGVMGGPMAGHLVNKGYDVIVYNRTLNKAKLWTQTYNGKFAESPKEVAANSEVIFTCVGNDDDVLSVVKGEEGILSGITSDCILVDHTTASANLARKLYKEFHSQGLGFIDAPVSGGQAGAENGLLSIMCGGDEKDYVRVLPILKSYGKKISLIGKSGSGQLAKMVNQICIAGLVQALSEGTGDFINGCRLVYPRSKVAMPYLNTFANRFFAAIFSWLLRQRIKDTLCGTKVLWNSDYQLIKKGRSYFGNFDPFGDFDLLFGASKLNLKIQQKLMKHLSKK